MRFVVEVAAVNSHDITEKQPVGGRLQEHPHQAGSDEAAVGVRHSDLREQPRRGEDDAVGGGEDAEHREGGGALRRAGTLLFSAVVRFTLVP